MRVRGARAAPKQGPSSIFENSLSSLGGGTVVPRVSKAKKGLIASIILTRAKHAALL